MLQGFRTEKSKVEPGFCPSHFVGFWMLLSLTGHKDVDCAR